MSHVKEIVILSGKGGTGKTSVVAALADLGASQGRLVLVDADVDAANLELVLEPTLLESHDFYGSQEADIDQELCISCGRCAEVCRFEAILERDGQYQVDPLGCEGCGACFYVCPVEAISIHERLTGRWFRSETQYGMLFHAHLTAGQENSGKLVTTVKKAAREFAGNERSDYLLVDGPPGLGCPVIAASSGADVIVIVTEPTVAGVHDMERVLATASHFGIPALVVINKYDLDLNNARAIESHCEGQGVPVIGRVPFDQVVTEAMVQGVPVTRYRDGVVTAELKKVWARLSASVPVSQR